MPYSFQQIHSHSILYESSSSRLCIFPNSDFSNVYSIPFHLFNSSLFSTFDNYLLCQPSQNQLSIYQFNLRHINKPPTLHSTYKIPSQFKISVASWATTASNQPFVLLGTRDGSLLRLDFQHSELLPLSLSNSSSSPVTCTNSTPITSRQSLFYPTQTPIYDSFIPSSYSSPPPSPAPLFTTPYLATVSSIAPAPCGAGTFAVGYAAGHISIIQLSSLSTYRQIHKIQPLGFPKKITALAWHYSSKNPAVQTLAALRHGSDKLLIWTVDLSSPAFKQIRKLDLSSSYPLPETPCFGISNCSYGSTFLQWSRLGKIITLSSKGLVISDVRTKQVVTKIIPIPGSISAVLLKSSLGKAVVLSSLGNFYPCDLIDPCSPLPIPFNPIYSPESSGIDNDATILDSPVVFLQPVKVGQVIQIEINPTLTHAKVAPLKLEMAPVKAALQSLFPAVVKNLNKMAPQAAPKFFPSTQTLEKYLVCALFGKVFDTTICLMGMRSLIINAANGQSDLPNFDSEVKTLVLKLLAKGPAPPVLNELMQQVNSLPKPLFSALVSHSADQSPDGLALAQSVLQKSGNLTHLHLSCAYLYVNSRANDAQHLYLAAHMYLEALILSFLDPNTLDAVTTLKQWISHLSRSKSTPLVPYLDDLVTNVETGLDSFIFSDADVFDFFEQPNNDKSPRSVNSWCSSSSVPKPTVCQTPSTPSTLVSEECESPGLGSPKITESVPYHGTQYAYKKQLYRNSMKYGRPRGYTVQYPGSPVSLNGAGSMSVSPPRSQMRSSQQFYHWQATPNFI